MTPPSNCPTARPTPFTGPKNAACLVHETDVPTGDTVSYDGQATAPTLTITEPTTLDVIDTFQSAPAITLVKNVNRQHEPSGPALYLPVGSPLAFTYLVTNTGNVTLNPVTVNDNVLGAIACPEASLKPQASETCTKTVAAEPGQHTNKATATGQGVDNTGAPVGPPVSATDTANYFGSAPALTLVKDINGQHEPTAPGLSVPDGSTVTFTYRVTNTGNVALDRVIVTDNVLRAISCPKASLAPNSSEICTKTAVAQAGTQTNIGAVTAQPVNGSDQPVGATTSAADPATYTGTTAPVSPTTTGAVPSPGAPSSPNGLGAIGTDLGRWTKKHGPAAWALTVGIGAAAAGMGLFGVRRRRSRSGIAVDKGSNEG